MYGLRTVLSGTLLPSRPIALAFPEVMRDLEALGLRGRRPWLRSRAMAGSARQHRRGRHPKRTRRRVRGLSRDSRASCAQLRRARMAHQRRGAPRAGGGESRVSQRHARPLSLSMHRRGARPQDDRDSDHASDARRGDGSSGNSGCAAAHRFYLEQFKDDALNVHTIHAETEGMGQLEMFTALATCAEGARRGVRAPRGSGLEPRCRGAAGLSCDSDDVARPRRLDFRPRPDDARTAACLSARAFCGMTIALGL